MKPALTVEEWADPDKFSYSNIACRTVEVAGGWYGHAIAALCLHEQPFGFTREDVTLLREVAAEGDVGGSRGDTEMIAGFESLIARIEALLPPESE